MIRIRLKNGDMDLYREDELVYVCQEIIDDEYIVGEKILEARDFEELRGLGQTDCRLILVNGDYREIAVVRRTEY